MEVQGAKHSVVIKTPPGGERGVFANRDIKKGSIIALLPDKMDVVFNETADPDDFGWLKMASGLALDAANGDSFHQPYYRALPMLQDPLHTLHYVTLPPEYISLLKCKSIEESIHEAQEDLKIYWEKTGDELTQQGVTLDKLKAAVVTLFTRMISIAQEGDDRAYFVPLLDFANHASNCTNDLEYKPCDNDPEYSGNKVEGAADSKEWCSFWIAGTDIKEGEEVCFFYKTDTPDKAFLKFGFILPDEPPAMSLLDMPNCGWERTYVSNINGPLSAMKKELKRIEKKIKVLERVVSEEAAMKVAPTDPGGRVLEGLKRLRQQRQTALGNEAAGLRESIRKKESQEGGKGKDEL